MSTKLLYYGSLEKHMNAYMKQVKQSEFNQQLQLAQNRIVREGELMNLSQADIMNKLKQLQEDLKTQAARSIVIPLSKTNAPELLKQKIGSFNKPVINTVLLESIQNKKASLKKIPSAEPKEKKLTPFQNDLKEKIKSRSQSNSPISTTTGTTSSSTEDLSASIDKRHFNTVKGEVMKLIKHHNLLIKLDDYNTIAKLNELHSKIIDQHGSGLRKSKKIYVNI